jgi:prevent-host-death family protein
MNRWGWIAGDGGGAQGAALGETLVPQFSIHEAKIQLSKLIAKALAGEDVVITRRGVPVVRLAPIAPRGQRRFGALKGKIAIDGRLQDPLPEHERGGWDLAWKSP